MNLTTALRSLFTIHEADAHCDIPCGIYDPITAKIAAQTVAKMVMRIDALEAPTASSTAAERAAYVNTIARYVAVKEEHAQLVKNELDILWHDYFRPDHLETYPNLHTQIWQADKLASQNKQAVNKAAADQLVEAVDAIAKTFWATKGIDYSDPVATVRFGT